MEGQPEKQLRVFGKKSCDYFRAGGALLRFAFVNLTNCPVNCWCHPRQDYVGKLVQQTMGAKQ